MMNDNLAPAGNLAPAPFVDPARQWAHDVSQAIGRVVVAAMSYEQSDFDRAMLELEATLHRWITRCPN